MTHHHANFSGHHVTNPHQERIGTVTDVVYDHAGDEPRWLVVKLGLLQAERFVPIEGSYETEDGNIVVPFDKKWIKSAPTARTHVMSKEIEHEAAEHYDMWS